MLVAAGCATVPSDRLPPDPGLPTPDDIAGPLYAWEISGGLLPEADTPPRPAGGPRAVLGNTPSPCRQFDGETFAVRLRYVVSAQGEVIAAGPVEAADDRAYRAVVIGLHRTPYEPGHRGGEPVAVLVEDSFTFRCYSETTRY